MVCGLHDDDVRTEVGSEQQTQCLDDIRLLGLAARQTELGELLVGTKHHQLGAKHNPEVKQTVGLMCSTTPLDK